LRRLTETPNSFAASAWRNPRGLMNSSSSISPGGIVGPRQLGFLVIVFDSDLKGIAFQPFTTVRT
jgi:hypothetical protein